MVLSQSTPALTRDPVLTLSNVDGVTLEVREALEPGVARLHTTDPTDGDETVFLLDEDTALQVYQAVREACGAAEGVVVLPAPEEPTGHEVTHRGDGWVTRRDGHLVKVRADRPLDAHAARELAASVAVLAERAGRARHDPAEVEALTALVADWPPGVTPPAAMKEAAVRRAIAVLEWADRSGRARTTDGQR